MVRRLATVPVPATGEALHGYLDRASHAISTPLGAVLYSLHIDAREVLGGQPTCKISAQLADSIDEGLDLPPGTARRLTLEGRYGALLPNLVAATNYMDVNRAAARDWFFIAGSRYCSPCIEEAGVWQLAWHLPLTVACTLHGTLLADRCPSCGAFPRSAGTGRRGHRAAWEGQVRNPTTCPSPKRVPLASTGMASEPCASLLTTGPPRPASPTILRAQQLMDAILAGHRVTIAGLELGSSSGLLGLREVTCLGTRLRIREQGDPTRRRLWRTPPWATSAVTVALETTEPIWNAPTPQAAGDELRRLAQLHHIAVDKNYFRDLLGQQQILSPVYTAALAQTGRLSTRLRRAAEQETSLDLYTFDTRTVPQLAWICCLPAPLLARPGRPSLHMVRAVFSLSLARLQAGTWQAAAEVLGFPPRSGPQWSRYAIANLSRPQRNALFEATLQTAARLQKAPAQPDYSTNRPVITTARELAHAQAGQCPPISEWCPHPRADPPSLPSSTTDEEKRCTST